MGGARLEESLRAEETAEAKVSSLVQYEAVALLDAKACQQMALETELQAEATKTQGANASMMEAMTTTLEAEKEELFAEREELNVQLSMFKKKVVALTLQEREPPQQVLYQRPATMPFIRSVPPLVSQSPGVSPMQGQTMHMRSPTPPVQTRSLMQSARVLHISEVARTKPVDTNISTTTTSLPVQSQGENFSSRCGFSGDGHEQEHQLCFAQWGHPKDRLDSEHQLFIQRWHFPSDRHEEQHAFLFVQ